MTTSVIEGKASVEDATPITRHVTIAPPRPTRGRPFRLQAAMVVGSVGVLALLLLFAAVPDLVAPYRAMAMDSGATLAPPGARHWFGADQFGRDVLSLIIFGARQTLLLAFLATLASSTVGAFLGMTAGYVGGALDMVVMRVIDTWMSVPPMLLAISVCTALGPSLTTMILAVSVALLPRYARVLRAGAIALRSRGFIEAARVSGSSDWSIIRKHVLPHCLGPLLVIGTMGAGWAIIIGSSLSFLGFGGNEDRPDWAYLLAQGRGYVTVAWWTVTFPGLAIALFAVATNLLGDALKRRLDPTGAR